MITVEANFVPEILPYMTNKAVLDAFGTPEGNKEMWNILVDIFAINNNEKYGFSTIGGQFAYEAVKANSSELDFFVNIARKIDEGTITTDEVIELMDDAIEKEEIYSEHAIVAMLTWAVTREFENRENFVVSRVWNNRYRGFSVHKKPRFGERNTARSVMVFTDKNDQTGIYTGFWADMMEHGHNFYTSDDATTVFKDEISYTNNSEEFVPTLRREIENVMK